MKEKYGYIVAVFLAVCLGLCGAADAKVLIQCPCYDDPAAGPATISANGNVECAVGATNVACKFITASDGYALMAEQVLPGERTEMYIFGFHDVTPEVHNLVQTPPPPPITLEDAIHDLVMQQGRLAAEFSAPTIRVNEGQEFYLTLSTVPMILRPDLFDPHTVHWHGFPNASTIFDGEPMASIAINQGSSLTYYYNVVNPGTFMYHCHVEAPEHMQMGMLGNLYVYPAAAGQAYNHASTAFDVEFPIQVVSFDPLFHAADEEAQPLPFASMRDTYPMLNGRGYPDTTDPANLPAPLNKVDFGGAATSSQRLSALITANVNQQVLLRFSSLATVDVYTISSPSIPMKVIGKDAKIMRSNGDPAGAFDTSFTTHSITLGGGEAVDVILDTSGVPAGTYFLYSTNLNELSNHFEEFGGMMTEIVLN
jgi:FtsP/CotA-like multicopper oxidase with cupredoxin domain